MNGTPVPGDHRLPSRRVRLLVAASIATVAAVAITGTTLAINHAGGTNVFPALISSPTATTSSGSTSGNDNVVSARPSSQPPATIPPQPAPTTSSTQAAPGIVVITEATQGPVSLTRGNEIEVNLSRSAQAWSVPLSSDSSVLLRISGSTGPDGSAHAIFRAISDGHVSVLAAMAPASCAPHCLPAQRAIDFAINVSG